MLFFCLEMGSADRCLVGGENQEVDCQHGLSVFRFLCSRRAHCRRLLLLLSHFLLGNRSHHGINWTPGNEVCLFPTILASQVPHYTEQLGEGSSIIQ